MLAKKRKFYQSSSWRWENDAYVICLDDRVIRTPGGQVLNTPTQALAEAVCAEWNGQNDWIVPSSMPLTQLVNTALDRIEGQRDVLLAEMMAYLDTDLVCYRVDAPLDLVNRQIAVWQPLLEWLDETHGIKMLTTCGLQALSQTDETRARMMARLNELDTIGLTVVQCALAVSASLVLSLALEAGRIGGEELFALSQLEESWQIEQWGEDEEATVRRTALRHDAMQAERYLRLARNAGIKAEEL